MNQKLKHLPLKLKQFVYLFVYIVVASLAVIPVTTFADKLREYLQMDLSSLMGTEVYSASLFPEPIVTAPGSVTVVTKNQIRERGYRHLADLLSDLPGIDINHYADGISLDVYSFRGISGNNKILILQDGIRINSPSGDPMPIANNFPLYHIKQVEIIHGPGSSLYGADAFSGVINLITHDYDEENSGEVFIEAGEFGYQNTYFNIKQLLGENIGLSLGGHLHSSDNPDLDHYYATELPYNGRSGFEQPTDSHSLNLLLNWDKNIKLGYSRNYINNPTSAGAYTSFVDYSANAEYRSLLQTAYAKFHFDIKDNFGFDLNLDHSDYEVQPESEFVNQFTGLKHDGYKYAKASRTQIEPRFLWESDRQRVIAGLSYAFLKSSPKSANLPQPYDGSVQYYLNTNDSLPIEIFSVAEHNLGSYLQLTSHWDSHWATTIGARYDEHSTYGSSFTPRVSLTFAQNKKTNWELSYAESFLAPSTFHRFENYGGFAGDADNNGLYESWFMHVPNTDLNPENLKAIELSVNRNPTPWLSYGAVVYHQRVDGIITATNSPVVQTNFVPGGEIFYTTQNYNIGELSTTGIELNSSYTLKIKGVDAKFWANVALVDGSIDELGTKNDLPYTTNAKFKGGVTLNWNKYTLTTRMHWLGNTNGGVDTAGKDADSHVVIHLYAKRNDFLVKGVDLHLTVNNLFDQRYFESGDGSSGGGGSGLDLVPQDPRWVKLGISYHY